MVLGLGGSMRPTSRALEALRVALVGAARAGARTRLLSVRDLSLPLLDPDQPVRAGAANTLLEEAGRADAVILASPVYQGTVSGALKNALDHLWSVEHDELHLLAGRVVGRISVSGSLPVSGASLALQTACRALGAWVLPDPVDLGGGSFDAEDALCDLFARDRLHRLGRLVTLAAVARAAQERVGTAADALARTDG